MDDVTFLLSEILEELRLLNGRLGSMELDVSSIESTLTGLDSVDGEFFKSRLALEQISSDISTIALSMP